ncbi:MAG: dual OB domain-containing protein [Anaerolineae bacterium]
MPVREVLILAMTKMKSGICTAGFTTERAPVTGLRWVRPTREFDTVLPEDMMDADGHLILCGDVVTLKLLKPRPEPPHVEDWITDFVRHRPRRLRRLEGEKRAAFFPRHLDGAPEEVFIDHKRSLCLVQPEQVWAFFSLDRYSGKYEVRLRFTLSGEVQCPRATGRRGVPVTDLKWRALGRRWLAQEKRSSLQLTHEALLERLEAEAIYLTLGLSRQWKGEYWPLAHAVHVVPDYDVTVDLENL